MIERDNIKVVIMDKKILIPIVLLAFFIFLTPVDAFVMYNGQPLFDTNYSGTIVEDLGWNVSGNHSLICFDVDWNATYGGKSGIFYAEATDDCFGNITEEYYSTINVYPASDYYFLHSNDTSQTSLAVSDYASWNIWNKEIIVFLRYRLSNNSGAVSPIGTTHHLVIGQIGQQQFIELNLTEDVWHEYIGYIPAELNASRSADILAYMTFGYGNPNENATIWVDTFEVMTFDSIDINPPSISTEYARWFCNESSGTVENLLTNTSNGTVIEVWRVNRTEEATFNLSCGILRLNKTNIGRRQIDGFPSSAPFPRSKSIIARDWFWVYYRIDAPFPAQHDMIYTKLSVAENEVSVPFGTGAESFNMHINGSLGGTFTVNYSFVNSRDKFRDFNNMQDISGSQYALWQPFIISSGWHDFFSLSCIGTQQYFCTANTMYSMDTRCNIVGETSCGLWGCTSPEGEGSTCNYGEVGCFCLNNITVRCTNETGHILNETVCSPDTTCYEGECLTESQIQAQNITLIGTGSEIVGGLFGIDDANALMLISFIVAIIFSIIGAIKIQTHGGIVFGLIFISFLVLFGVLTWIPAWIVVVMVILSGIVVAYSMKGMFM